MSWHAHRFNHEEVKVKIRIFGSSAEDLTKFLRGRVRKDTLTNHHVPPRSKGWNRQTGFTLQKRLIDHLAYHQLFENAGTFEECCDILKRQWWTKDAP